MIDMSNIQPVGTNELVFEPQQRDVVRYAHKSGIVTTWEGDGWYDECRSWFETSYIHGGISGFQFTISGPDAQKLLSDLSINNVYKWKIGGCKHLVMCNEEGLILNHALYMRDSEDVFRTTAGTPDPVLNRAKTGGYDVQIESSTVYVFQFSGPKSLTILEKLTQTDLHDLPFLGNRWVKIPELDLETEVSRIGMSGTLAYELRGPAEDGPRVYAAAFNAGEQYGIKRLGWRSYPVNHNFGGFPQITCSFESALCEDEEFCRTSLAPFVPTGSVDPENKRARFRTPGEVDWLWMAKFDHDFVGREAVESESKNPKRAIKSLVWNTEDIKDIYASLFEEGEPYKYMEFPSAEIQPAGGHQDYIFTPDGREIGYSSVPIYSSWYHLTVSQACLDIDQAVDGTELIVKWGDYGKRMKDVRVTVAKYPYIDLPDNRGYDLSTVEHGNI